MTPQEVSLVTIRSALNLIDSHYRVKTICYRCRKTGRLVIDYDSFSNWLLSHGHGNISLVVEYENEYSYNDKTFKRWDRLINISIPPRRDNEIVSSS